MNVIVVHILEMLYNFWFENTKSTSRPKKTNKQTNKQTNEQNKLPHEKSNSRSKAFLDMSGTFRLLLFF